MSPIELVLILALVGYAVYQQTRRHELKPSSRFTLAAIYGIVGLAVGGLSAFPTSVAQWSFFAASVALSVVVGLVRGRLTRVWPENGTWYSQGSVLTVSIFLAMIAGKFALGTLAYFMHVTETSGIGEILVMIAVMMALQAQIVHVRATRLAARTAGARPGHVHAGTSVPPEQFEGN